MKKTTINILILCLLFIGSCTKEQKEFCTDCIVVEKPENYVPLSQGWISYSGLLNRYIIEMPSYNISYDYCPCEFPEYFVLAENQTVKFKGYKTESVIYETALSEITCIRLDTIYPYDE
jgi:hypothetical protein